MIPKRHDHTTTRLAAQRVRPYEASASPQELELVAAYATPIVRLRVQECVATFVALANAGFFSEHGLAGLISSADTGRETVGERADDDSVVLGAWAIPIVGVCVEGISWLARALELSGARVEWWSVAFVARESSSRVQPVATVFPFRTISRRGTGGYHLRLTLACAVTDPHEAAFRRLIYLWMAFVRVLPSRDGRGRSRLTSRPSYERGGNVLAVAGRELDADDKAATMCLFAAIGRYHEATAPVAEALAEMG